MYRYFDALITNLASVTKYGVSLVALLGGFISCLAVALFVAHLALIQPDKAIQGFAVVMSFSGAGISESLREVISVCNWFGLSAVTYVSINSAFSYFERASRKAVHKNVVVAFPKKLAEQSSQKARVSNL